MGIYDRDYDTGSGWRDSYSGGPGGANFSSWSTNSKLLVVIVGVYVAQTVFGPAFTNAFSLWADWLAKPWLVFGLATYPLLHDTGGLSHLLFNGLALFFFGRTIQARLGGREYLAFFFAAAIFAGLVWSGAEVLQNPDVLKSGVEEGVTLVDAAGQPVDPAVVRQYRVPHMLGASGGIAAIVLLFALWYPNVQVYIMGVVPVPAWVMAIIFLGQDILGALSRSGNVAYSAHLGGALFGYLYFRYRWRLESYLPSGESLASWGDLFKRKPKLRVHRAAFDDDSEAVNPGDERVDEILRKIQAQGQDSLTREEQRILERASRRYKNRRQ